MGPINSIRDVFSALRRRLALIVLVLAIGLPAALWFAQSRPRTYEATAVIQIEAPQIAADVTGDTGAAFSATSQLDLIQQQLLSRDRLADVITRFALFPQVTSMSQRVGLLRASVRIVKLIDPALAMRPDVSPSGLTITLQMGDGVQAAAVANDFVNTIITEAAARSAARASRTLDFLSAEATRVGIAIETVDAEIAAFRETRVDALPEGVTTQRDRLNRLNESLTALDQQILTLESDRDRRRAEDVARQTALLIQQRALLTQGLAETEAALAAAPGVERELGALNRRLEGLEAELAVVATRRAEAAMTQLLETRNEVESYEVLETAIPPDYPVSASRTKVALAGAGLALMLAIGLALALEVLNPAIRTAAQLERELGVQPVIVVPLLRSRGAARRRRGLGVLLALLALGGGLALALSGRLAGWISTLPGVNRAAAAVPVTIGRHR